MKKYLLYAIGEIVLIVSGILIAMYVNNYNANRKYQKTFDQSLFKAAKELKINLDYANQGIAMMQDTDSLIRLAIHDSLTLADYKANYATLISLSRRAIQFSIGTEDYNNLISYNISENDYKSEAIQALGEAYAYKDIIDKRGKDNFNFMDQYSIPFLMKNTNYTDMFYKVKFQDSDFDVFLHSPEYKSILTLFNDKNYALMNNFIAFYKLGVSAYNDLADEFDLEKITYTPKEEIDKFLGTYVNRVSRDTINVLYERDSIVLHRKEVKATLNSISDFQYFTATKRHAYRFVTFDNTQEKPFFTVHWSNLYQVYDKVEE